MARQRKPKTKTSKANGPKATAGSKPAQVHNPVTSKSSSAAPTFSLLDDLLPPEPDMPHLSTVRVLLMGAVVLSVGTLGFALIPGMVDAEKPGHYLVNAFYCATMTLTTIGFGDICPGDTALEGKLFIIFLSLAGLGIFCGPIVQMGAAWRHAIPGGTASVAVLALGLGVTIFTQLEDLDHFHAIYASVITSTTIGYGDVTPKTDIGKVAVALYAIVSVYAMGILLQPSRAWLEAMCQRPQKQPAQTKVSTKND